MGRGPRDVRDFSVEDIDRSIAEAEQLVEMKMGRAAVMVAWAAFESAMRMRIRAEGGRAGWGANSRVMLNELYSTGALSDSEFRQLESLSMLRNQIVHGFTSLSSESHSTTFDEVSLLRDVGLRLAYESAMVAQSA